MMEKNQSAKSFKQDRLTQCRQIGKDSQWREKQRKVCAPVQAVTSASDSPAPAINGVSEGSCYLKIKEKARGFSGEVALDQATNNLRTGN